MSEPRGSLRQAHPCVAPSRPEGWLAEVPSTEATVPRLLDLFCGAGGASVGYHRAGFHVVGVDIAPQPHYPFEFHQADALTFPLDGFDVVHASPPCQAHTTMSNRYRGGGGMTDDYARLIALARWRLMMYGRPYVIENVPGARPAMVRPVTLNGGMFGLRVMRPRLFECSWPASRAPSRGPVIDAVGVYGRYPDGRRLFDRKDGTSQHAAASLEEGARAMGIDWMEWSELTQAIPPVYAEHLGRQLQERHEFSH